MSEQITDPQSFSRCLELVERIAEKDGRFIVHAGMAARLPQSTLARLQRFWTESRAITKELKKLKPKP